jgi:hypothetical protein
MSSTLRLSRHVRSIQRSLDAVAKVLAVRKKKKAKKSKAKKRRRSR